MQTYVADIFLAQSWRDHRLRLPENMTEEYRILDVGWLHNIWRPDCFFKNAKKGKSNIATEIWLTDGLAQTSWPRQSGPFLHKDCTGPDSPISMGQNAVFRYFIGPKRRGARKSGPKRRF